MRLKLGVGEVFERPLCLHHVADVSALSPGSYTLRAECGGAVSNDIRVDVWRKDGRLVAQASPVEEPSEADERQDG